MRFQNTINKETYITGTGLHSGREINIILKPAPRDTGVVFIRSDKGNVEIKASVASVSDTSFATTLAKNGVRVGTVEHLLSAFAGMNIDNVYVELDGPENSNYGWKRPAFCFKFIGNWHSKAGKESLLSQDSGACCGY